MVDLAQDFDFSLKGKLIIALKGRFVDDLDRKFFVGSLLNAFPDNGEASFSKDRVKFIVVFEGSGLIN